MNFIEFLQEETEKELYVLVNVKTKIAPNIDGEEFKTYAVSPEKAYHQILFRLREAPDRYKWAVINNRDDYFVLTWDEYNALMTAKKPKVEELPPLKRREDPQMKLFPDQHNPPD